MKSKILAIKKDYTDMSLEDAFILQRNAQNFRSSGQNAVESQKSVSNWYAGFSQWTPGVRQIYDYWKLYSRHRANTNNRGHFTLQEFWLKFPASYVFETSCHIKYQLNMYWEIAEAHQQKYSSRWTLDNKMFLKRPR